MSTPPKTRHDAICEFRCGQILAAARKVFADKGYQDATMDEIAERAGVAKGTLYSYFPSKRDVYVAELSRGGAELLELTGKALAYPGDVRSKLLAFVRLRLEYLDSHLEYFQIYQSEFGNMTHPAWVSEQFRQSYRQQLLLLEGLLEDGIRRGEIRDLRAGVVASGIYEMTRGLLLRRVLGAAGGSVEEESEDLVGMLWKGIRSE